MYKNEEFYLEHSKLLIGAENARCNFLKKNKKKVTLTTLERTLNELTQLYLIFQQKLWVFQYETVITTETYFNSLNVLTGNMLNSIQELKDCAIRNDKAILPQDIKILLTSQEYTFEK